MTGLPPNWSWATFAEVANVAADLVDPADYPETPHVAPNHIESGTGKLAGVGTVRGDGVTSPKHRFRPGQVLYSKIRPYLAKATLAPYSGLCSADMYPIDARIDPRFLLHWMLSDDFTGHAAAHQGRSVLPKINQAALSTLPVPVAPLAEQMRIVAAIEEAFSLLDAGETALRNIRTRLKRMRDSVLTAAVTGQLTSQDPTDTPADKLLADLEIPIRSSSETGLETPARWAWARVSDLLAEPLANGRSVPTRDDGFPVLRLTCLKGGGIDLRERKGGDWSAVEAAPFLVETGDFLVSRGNGSLKLVGRGGLVRSANDPVAFPDTLIRVRLTSAAVSTRLLDVWWRTGWVRRHVESRARTTAGIYKINQGVIEDLLLPVPPYAEQGRIVAEVERQFSFIEAAERAVNAGLARAAGLRRSVLTAAFEGRLVEQDPTDEPAAVLLERISAERAAAEPGKRAPRRARKKAVAS